ncbi:MAG: class I SAM-dependent methyltransferase [Candidatus Dojkabacteria bacterium]
MGNWLSSSESLTEYPFIAKGIWDDITMEIKNVGREDILSSPAILDIGGGMGNFSAVVNHEGFFCVSLDIQPLSLTRLANPTRGDAYHMPFPDSSFET